MSLSDNPFVFFARCGTNKIAHVSIHHPFAKEELYDKIKIQSGILFEEIRESVLKNAMSNDEEYRNIKIEQHSLYERNQIVVHLADQDIDE